MCNVTFELIPIVFLLTFPIFEHSSPYNLLQQVHKAVLKDGKEVAVKIQHKTVKQHAFQDAKVIEVWEINSFLLKNGP